MRCLDQFDASTIYPTLDVKNEQNEMSATKAPAKDINYEYSGTNEKMESYMAMSEITNMLSNFKGKLHTLDVLSHKVNELLDHRNVVNQKLHLIQESLNIIQLNSNHINRLENNVEYILRRVDDAIPQRQSSYNQHSSLKKSDDNESGAVNSGEQIVNCESKIDHLISFVHSFAEINRVESGDILNRLGNMQTQLIQFFDAKGATAKKSSQATIAVETKTPVSSTQNDSKEKEEKEDKEENAFIQHATWQNNVSNEQKNYENNVTNYYNFNFNEKSKSRRRKRMINYDGNKMVCLYQCLNCSSKR